jgi:DNA-binding NarL/FixJ family response regulator
MNIRALLADDHAVLRNGLRMLLESSGGIEIVGEAANGRDAIREAERLLPDVAIFDVSMPKVDGIDATWAVCGKCPEVKVIILSVIDDPEKVRRALRAGARGYLLKSSAAREVVAAVRAVHAGHRYLSDRIAHLAS